MGERLSRLDRSQRYQLVARFQSLDYIIGFSSAHFHPSACPAEAQGQKGIQSIFASHNPSPFSPCPSAPDAALCRGDGQARPARGTVLRGWFLPVCPASPPPLRQSSLRHSDITPPCVAPPST